MDERQPPALTPTKVFDRARFIGEQKRRRENGLLTVHRVAGTLVRIADRLAGIPGSYAATDLQERTLDLREELHNTTGALQILDNLQAVYDPRGVAVERVRHDFAAAMVLAPVTGTPVPIDSIVASFSKAQRLLSSLPTATFPKQCEVDGRKIEIIVADSNPGSETLFDYALHLQKQMPSNRAS